MVHPFESDKAMAKITVTKLRCERKQDISGDDEPILVIDDQEVWAGKMGKGDTQYPNVSHSFDQSAVVELKERDSKKDKSLGSWMIRGQAQSETMVIATSSGYHYQLWYEVEAGAA